MAFFAFKMNKRLAKSRREIKSQNTLLDGLNRKLLNTNKRRGTDIIAAIVNKYHNISLGRVLIFVDLLIVGSSFFGCYTVYSSSKTSPLPHHKEKDG